MNKYEITKCRACGSEYLKSIISLGEQYVSNFIKSEEEQGEKVPLELVLCENCKLLQLKHNALLVQCGMNNIGISLQLIK